MNMKDWERKVAGLTYKDAKKYADAVKTLREWSVFEKEFKGTGLFGIGVMLTHKDYCNDICGARV